MATGLDDKAEKKEDTKNKPEEDMVRVLRLEWECEGWN